MVRRGRLGFYLRMWKRYKFEPWVQKKVDVSKGEAIKVIALFMIAVSLATAVAYMSGYSTGRESVPRPVYEVSK